jgi:predicted nucleic acid-binding protein
MSQKVVIDASVFISSVSKDEHFYKDSVALIKKVAAEEIQVVIPILTIFEILQSLYRKTQDMKKVDRVYQQLIDLNVSKSLTIIRLEADFLAYFVTHHHKFPLKTSDAVIALTAEREHCPLISWDKQMLKAASKNVETYTPTEFLKHFNATPDFFSMAGKLKIKSKNIMKAREGMEKHYKRF